MNNIVSCNIKVVTYETNLKYFPIHTIFHLNIWFLLFTLEKIVLIVSIVYIYTFETPTEVKLYRPRDKKFNDLSKEYY